MSPKRLHGGMMTFYQLLDCLSVEAFLLHANNLGRVYFSNRMYTCTKTRNLEKIQVRTGFEPMTFTMPVQRSTY